MTGFASISSSRGTVWYLLDTVVFYYCSWDDNKGSNATNYYYSYFLKRRVACTRSFFSTISRVKSQRVAIPVWVTIVPIGRLTSCYSGTTPFLVCRAPLIPLRPVLKRSIIVIIIIIITTTTGISTATRVENCADTAINPWATSWIRRLSNVGLRRAAFGPAPVCLPVIAKQTISWVPPPPSPQGNNLLLLRFLLLLLLLLLALFLARLRLRLRFCRWRLGVPSSPLSSMFIAIARRLFASWRPGEVVWPRRW